MIKSKQGYANTNVILGRYQIFVMRELNLFYLPLINFVHKYEIRRFSTFPSYNEWLKLNDILYLDNNSCYAYYFYLLFILCARVRKSPKYWIEYHKNLHQDEMPVRQPETIAGEYTIRCLFCLLDGQLIFLQLQYMW